MIDEAGHYLARLDQPRGCSACRRHSRRAPVPTVTSPRSRPTAGDVCHLQIESIERFAGPRNRSDRRAGRRRRPGRAVLIACHNEGEQQRLAELLAKPARLDRPRRRSCAWVRSRAAFAWSANGSSSSATTNCSAASDLRRDPRGASSSKPGPSTASSSCARATRRAPHPRHRPLPRHGDAREGRPDRRAPGPGVPRRRAAVRAGRRRSTSCRSTSAAAKAAPKLSKLGGTSWAQEEAGVAEAVTRPGRRHDRAAGRAGVAAGHRLPARHRTGSRSSRRRFPTRETPDQLDAIADVKARHGASRGRWTG